MGLSPEIWGSSGWRFIHSVALAYPIEPTEEDKENYKKFFESIPKVLPCSICGEHFQEKLDTMPLILDTKKDLWEWTVDAHNQVNKENGKKELTYDEAMQEFDKNTKAITEKQQTQIQHNELTELFAGLGISLLIINLLSKN